MLSARKVQTQNRHGRYCDGGGLWLQVSPTGTKSWLFRFMLHGRARQMGLGAYPTFSLKEARERARLAKQLVTDGIDPIDAKHDSIAAARVDAAKRVTFRQVTEEFLQLSPVALKWTNDTHRKQWRQSLEDYAFPIVGSVPVGQIDVALVTKALTPIWKEYPATASRLRGRIEKVLAYATVKGLRSGDNPARWDILQTIFATSKQVHHAALKYDELPAFMARLKAVEGIHARAAEFMILTATRTSEALNSRWDEIDLEAGTWTIPPERMKARKEHRVPISAAALELLRSLPRVNEFVFAGTKGAASRSTLFKVVKEIDPEVTAHGFRATFRTWCAERTSYPEAVTEQALAHTIGTAVEKAYKRTDLFDRRRRLMSDWAKFCTAPAVISGNVVPMDKSRTA
jgi:integrase